MTKLFLIAFVGMYSIAGNAQIVSSTSRNIVTTTTEVKEVKKEKKTYFGIDASVGGQSNDFGAEGAVGLGFHWERSYSSPYLAWDVLSVFWDAPFESPTDFGRLSLKTGIRGFSPKFYRNMRAYANLDLGYTMNYYPDYDYYGYDDGTEFGHGFGLEFGLGIRLTNHFAVGYALDWDSETKLKGNYLRVSVLF